MPVITNAGEYLITQQQQAGEPLIIDQMILANITGLDSNTVPSREQSMPAPEDVKIIKPITKDGLLNTNTVVYSTVFPSTDGTFDFNYMGLYSSAHDVIVAVAYVPLQTKIKTVGTDVGNVITKNFAIEFNAAADITGINISAESWQIDYTARLMSMDKHQRDLVKNIYGPSTFLNDAFKVKFETDTYYLTAGKAILGGINFELDADLEIVPGTLPQTVWLDVYQETSMMGVLNKHDVVINDGTVLTDYVAGSVEHTLVKLGVVNSSVDIVDGRSLVKRSLELTTKNNDPKNIVELRKYRPEYAGQKLDIDGHTLPGLGGGPFFHDPDDSVSPDNNGTVIVNEWGDRWKRKLNGTISVEMFGAIADKVTNSSPAVLAAVNFVLSRAGTPTIGSNKILSGGIMFEGHEGEEYLLNDPKSLLPDSGVTRYVGLTFFAVNPGVTIHFGYDGNDYLCYNNNRHLFLRFYRLSFTCNSNTSKFMYSTGNGGAQDIYFEDCKWEGVWEKLYVLRGLNNNSEWGFQKCSVTASIRDVMLDMDESDQFLNYWWSMCKLWLYDGQCIRSKKGGHFKFNMCDWSGLSPGMSLNASVNGAPLFELLGNSHARGVCDFQILGGRFEHKNDLSKLIYCEWNQGAVKIDADTLSSFYTEPATETVVFDAKNSQGPVVEFSGSHQGIHRYKSSGNAWQFNSRAKYENVQTPHTSINDLIKVDTPSNAGGTWNISCDQVESTALLANSKSQRVLDCDIGARTSKSNVSKVRTVTFRNAQGEGNPLNGEEFSIEMPEQAVIVGVHWFNSGSLGSANNVTYELRDGAGAVISSKSGVISSGWDTRDNKTHVLAADRNTLVLVDTLANSNQQSVNIWCRVDYMYG